MARHEVTQLGDAQPPCGWPGYTRWRVWPINWQEHRQTCVDVLCAYLRTPYEPEPGDDAPMEKRLALQASSEVCHTIIRVVTAHLNGTRLSPGMT